MSILKRGLKGAPVRRLQRRLGIADDGDFGPGTERAVKEFQGAHNLAIDGIAGPDTFMALDMPELVLLRRGTRGETVKQLQQGLGLTADGIFGPGTEKAVRAFQEANGLDADGLAGPETLAKMDAFASITEDSIAKARVQPDEADFDGDPLPDLNGTEMVANTGTDVPEEKSVWGKIKGWFG